MRFLDYVECCNRHDLSNFLPLQYSGNTLGWVRTTWVDWLRDWKQVFRIADDRVELINVTGNLRQRGEPLGQVAQELASQGVINPLTGEMYPVTAGSREQAVMLIDRAAAPFFGVLTFGQHLNGFVRTDQGLKMWVGKRSAERLRFPGKFDHLVAGGLPYGVGLRENLAKECWEEAGIPSAVAAQAIAVGAVTYVIEFDRGLKPDVLYCYDLELPETFQPRCTDGEVEEFYLWPIEQVMETMKAREAFKLNCNLVIIDFLIRHGYVGPEYEGYLDLITGLHPKVP
ncbi:MAG: DUF4743 domain-containing protein [Gammaproteobacteria bacterium]|nr:DUF4743 domain-containing protein [Gammaproteobacteria bacterium]